MRLQKILFALTAALIACDGLWGALGHFDVDVRAYGWIALLCLALLAGGVFYTRWRREPRLAAMLLATCFLCAFSAAAALLNYFLLRVAGPRIDFSLAAIDRALGFDWPSVMGAMAGHPTLNAILFIAYSSMLPQVALLVLVLAGATRIDRLYRFCLALALAALLTMAAWTLAPSFGAFSVYPLSPMVAHKLTLALDGDYARQLVTLLHNGPGHIAPHQIRGLIGFPSFHAAMALLVVWYARGIRYLYRPILALNIGVLIATPIQGGHHLVDVLGAFPVALAAIVLTQILCSADRAKLSGLVNKRQILTLAMVPKGLFRAAPAQSAAPGADAIKPVLNQLP